MSEQFRQQTENQKPNEPEPAAGSLGLPSSGSEQAPRGGGSQSPERDLRGQAKEAPSAHSGHESARVQRALFENCIVGGLMPSMSQVEERLSEGLITEERAKQERESALARERMYAIGSRLADVQQMLRKGGLTAENETHLKAEELTLKEEWINLWGRA